MGLVNDGASCYVSHMDIHAHVETAARDCDGLYENMWVIPSKNEDDLAFIHRVTGLYASPYAIGSSMTVKSVRLDDGDVRMSISEPTDEGYRATEVTFCHDECDLDESGYRDHTAESMGY